jgi:hypothetical protein
MSIRGLQSSQSRPHYYVEPQTPKSTSGAKLSDESVQRPNLLQLQRLRLETPPESTETPPLPYYI